MSTAPEPSASRGEITLQPSYFTSSLYVNPLRQDLTALIDLFTKQFDGTTRPFDLFKKLWTDQGWCWLHLRVHDGRARQTFVATTERIFMEYFTETTSPMAQSIALFALYTFYFTQPSTSAPPTQYYAGNIAIPCDLYGTLLTLPSRLDESPLLKLKPYVVHVLSTLLDRKAFYILPHSSYKAQNPSQLPREIFVPEGQDMSTVLQATIPPGNDSNAAISAPSKKKGRPSKRDKIRKAKEALTSLEKYVDKNTVLRTPLSSDGTQPEVAHAIFGQAPHVSLANYGAQKDDLLATIHTDVPVGAEPTDPSLPSSQAALLRANEAVLQRLKQIDAMAAEQGLEVGGEGGEQTGLERVERAVDELRRSSGAGAGAGILALLEGAGMDANDQ